LKAHSPTWLKKKKGREEDPQNYNQETELEMTNKALFSFLLVQWVQQKFLTRKEEKEKEVKKEGWRHVVKFFGGAFVYY
jgi:hypothetical protein